MNRLSENRCSQDRLQPPGTEERRNAAVAAGLCACRRGVLRLTIAAQQWIACGVPVVALLVCPVVAAACPNCYAASDSRVLTTYYLSAIVLTLLPFTIIGVIAVVVRSRQRKARSAENASAPVAAGGTAS